MVSSPWAIAAGPSAPVRFRGTTGLGGPALERDPAQSDRGKGCEEQEERNPAQCAEAKLSHAPARYFFIQARIPRMIPITLRTDIIPAGIALPVWMNFGTN